MEPEKDWERITIIETSHRIWKSGVKSLSKRRINKKKNPLSKFFKIICVKPGHWRFLGHDIIRGEDRYWSTVPSRSLPHEYWWTKDDVIHALSNEYHAILQEVIQIEFERSQRAAS